MIEISLCFEVIETGKAFFREIEQRMEEYKVKDGLMKSTMKQLDTLLDELFDRSFESSGRLGEERFPRSRKLKTSQDIFEEIKKEMKIKKKTSELDKGDDKLGRRSGRGGRGGLLDAVSRLKCFFCVEQMRRMLISFFLLHRLLAVARTVVETAEA